MKNADFKGVFELFCKPTKTADNKKTVVELTAEYKLNEFMEVQKLWDETVNVSIVLEEVRDIETPVELDFIMLAPKVNKGSKDIKSFTVTIVRPFDIEDHLKLDKMLYQPVFVQMQKTQLDLDFDKKSDENEEDF